MTNKEAADVLLENGFTFCQTRKDRGHCVHVVPVAPIACKCCWCGVEYRFLDPSGKKFEVHGPHIS